jgi:hypothetical protein
LPAAFHDIVSIGLDTAKGLTLMRRGDLASDDLQRNVRIDFARRIAARGEPWLSLFDPADLHELLRSNGFKTVEDLGLSEIAEHLYGDLRRNVEIGPGPHIVRAYQ